MQTMTTPKALQEYCLAARQQGKTIAVIPTMGFFHAGHESLMSKGRQLADILIVTLFVNPTQFGPTEDLSAYPRKPEQDADIAHSHGTDILFTPSVEDMYLPDHATWVEVPTLAAGLCGQSRPVHFRGVCTVVTKLLLLTQAHFAVFGEKDWQQLAIVRKLVKDLHIPTEVVGIPTLREADGLALSSRNAYLTAEERAKAPQFFAGLTLARDMYQHGVSCVDQLASAIRAHWREHLSLGREDYLTFFHAQSLEPVTQATHDTRLAAAMYLGRARIIDNISIAAR